jgi:glycosyltransferase involved in cell wall biosynthesis
MHRPAVTVLTALYKAGPYIHAKIDNLLQQSIFDDCNFVLLNCQNHDNERATYEEFLKHDNVTEIFYPDHVNLYPTWNDGIKTTDSEFICNSNADDMWHPQYLENCVKFLQINKQYSIVTTYIDVADEPNQSDYTQWNIINSFPRMTYPDSTAGPCPVWRRSLHDKYGYFGDYAVIGDARIWERWLAGGEGFGLIPRVMALYYLNPESLERRFEDGIPLSQLDISKDTKKKPVRTRKLKRDG